MTIKDSKPSSTNIGEKLVFTIRLLSITKKLQQLHGLRHGDYQRYRSYCTRRIQRLRKSLHVPQGDKRHFRKKPITEAHLDKERAIHIPLMLAERAWSYAMQLRLESNTEPRKKFHVVSRLQKAVAHAIDLQKLCQDDRFNTYTKLEAEAYVGWMSGTLFFELKVWPEAIENFKRAQIIYEKLAVTSSDSEDTAYYKQRIEELTPSIRYCAYNIGDDTAIEELLQLRAHAHGDLLTNIDILMTQANESNAFTLNETEWLGKPLTVKSEKVRMFLLSNRDLEKTFNQNTISQNVDLLEQHLMDCKDAISAVQDDINIEQASQKSTKISVVSQLQHLFSYLTYIKLDRTIQRNLLLADMAKKNLSNPFDAYKGAKKLSKDNEDHKSNPRYISRLYELTLQHISEMEQIVGVKDDDRLTNQLRMQKMVFTAYRCYYIGMELVCLQHWNMAVAAYNEALHSAKDALTLQGVDQKLENHVRCLIETINYAKYTTCAYSVIGTDDRRSVSEKEKLQLSKIPLYDRLNSFSGGIILLPEQINSAPVCPNIKPIPFKPLFFDLVHDKFHFPPLKDKSQETKNTITTGLTGFVKGIWGWGGSKN